MSTPAPNLDDALKRLQDTIKKSTDEISKSLDDLAKALNASLEETIKRIRQSAGSTATRPTPRPRT